MEITEPNSTLQFGNLPELLSECSSVVFISNTIYLLDMISAKEAFLNHF